MRMQCRVEGLEHNYIDVSDVWTRRDLRRLAEADGDEWVDIAREKLVTCHIDVVGGAAIEQPADLTIDALDSMDLRIVGWLGAALPYACSELRQLGFRSAVLSSGGNGTATVE